MSEFHVLKYGIEFFTPEIYNRFHQESKTFLLSELKDTGNSQTIIITHHTPPLLNYPGKYKGSILNEAFAVEVYDLISDSGASHWI